MTDIMSMALTEPALVVDVDDIATREAAALRASTIRIGIGRFVDIVVPEILAAWAQRDWVALGYDSWEAYVEGELGVDRLKLTRESRRAAIAVFRVAGMSTRAIGAALDVDQSTVVRDLPSLDSDASPETVTGTDGRTYPATQPAADREPEDDFGNKRSDYGDDDDDLTDDDDFETFVDVGQDDPDDLTPPGSVLVRQDGGEPRPARVTGLVAGVTRAVWVVYADDGFGAWVDRDRLVDIACAHDPVCGYPCPLANLARHAAEVAEVAPEYVTPVDEPVTPDSDWLESPSEGGAVTSSTPGNATDEAPADVDPDVEYDAWRSRIYGELSNAGRHLVNLTGDWQDADVFATRASEKQMLWLVDVGEKLTDFIGRALALRSPTVVPVDPDPDVIRGRAYAWQTRIKAEGSDARIWMEARRGNLPYHRPVGLGEGSRRLVQLGCERERTKGGAYLDIGTAVSVHGARPCPLCWPDEEI